MTSVPDEIQLHGLQLPTRIGVPEAERADWQTLTLDLQLSLQKRFETMGDELAETLDYAALALELRQLAAVRPRQLIETLATEIAAAVLAKTGVLGVTLTLKKQVLPGCLAVAVKLTR
jgi:7,8-dihydroneopterin aldolase/epimerase/oxygenase